MKTGDKVCTYKAGGDTWSRRLDAPIMGEVVDEHGSRDISIRHHGRIERMTRRAAERAGWQIATEEDERVLRLERAQRRAINALEIHQAIYASKDADALTALAVELEKWA